MKRYIWMIHAGEPAGEGALGDVYLSLHGLSATTKELRLPKRDFEAETVESGTIEVRDELGEIQTGTLRTEYADRSSWAPDWVKVINLSDGRQWTAKGGTCDAEGICPLLRFERTGDPLQVQKPSEEPSSDEDRSDSNEENVRDGHDVRRAIPVSVTYEVFGKHQGRVVPLAEILKIRAGVKHLTAGARILVTADDAQGFGLAGEPGLWDELYRGVSPAVYGLEPDRAVMASDGSRGWVLDAHTLAMVFGADWRRVVYGK